ncbi:MAG: hypothetical protein VR68_01555 [Peptococcaceae bacterium BRH_c4a]|nr:MAG: hypothetical protein VR68_01555 [Peptococcaceae bacterium BRH_c4a]
MHELQLILEDLRNQLAVIKGVVQLQRPSDKLYEKMLKDPINNADKLSMEALNIIQMFKLQKFV